MAFKFPLSASTRNRLDHEKALLARMHDRDTTSDLNLGIAILGMTRKLRQAYISAGRASSIQQDYPVYDGTLVWNVLPDLAYRLGITDKSRFLPGERAIGETVLTLNGADYRRYVWSVLRNSNLRGLVDHDANTAHTASLLTREAINGNPVEISLQRLYPAEQFYVRTKTVHPGNTDPADDITEPARMRGLPPTTLSWSPECMLQRA